jgi:parvulin-like peptidyl-prolyl isomerase
MLRTLLITASLALGFAAGLAGGAMPALAQSEFSAAAFVNESIITRYDVEQRAKVLQLTGVPQTDSLNDQALQNLIDDKIKRAAAKDEGVTLDQPTFEGARANVAKALQVAPDQLDAALRKRGISPEALNDFLQGEVLWGMLIRYKFGAFAKVTDADIDAAIGERGLNEKVTYNLGELSIPNGNDPAATMSQARKIAADVRGGADFKAQARQYSRSPTRSRGGVVGWVPEDRLPPEVRSALKDVPVGGVTDPIKVPGGVAVLTVFDKRVQQVTINGETRDQIRSRLIAERLAGRADEYLKQLRAKAYIEKL